MGHFKRGRPKKMRSGCLFCKPYKGNGWGWRAWTRQEYFSRVREREQREEVDGTLQTR